MAERRRKTGFDVGYWLKDKMTQPAAPVDKSRLNSKRPGAYSGMYSKQVDMQRSRTSRSSTGGPARQNRGDLTQSPYPKARPNTGGPATSPTPTPRQDRPTYSSSAPRTAPKPQAGATPRLMNRLDQAGKAYKSKRDKRFR